MTRALCAVFAITAARGWAQQALLPGDVRAPRVTHGTASGFQDASGTTIHLGSPSRILWDDFSVNAGDALRVQGGHASLHVVDGPLPSRINGTVTADGPFALINPGGIMVGRTGSITAPRVLLSALRADDDLALLNGAPTSFSADPERLDPNVTIDGRVEATAGPLIILGQQPHITRTGHVKAQGRVQIITAKNGVTGPHADGHMQVPTGHVDQRANFVNEGRIDGYQVEIISRGALRNSGGIFTSGKGNFVRLAAFAVRHENRPESIIQTSSLITDAASPPGIEGKVLEPDDGTTAGGVSGTRQIPRLSTGGLADQSITELRSSQLSFAPLQSVRTITPNLPPPGSSVTLASRGIVTEEEKQKAAAKRKASATGPVLMRKRMFFGRRE